MTPEKTDIYSSSDYKRSRGAYIAECTFEYFVSLLVTDAYLSNLLTYMGISDATIGIISSLISFAFLFQLFSLFAVKHITNVKRASIIFHFASQIFFMSLFLLPFLPFAKEYKTAIVIVCVLIAYFGNYLVTSVIFKWGMSYVDPHRRASFSATKEMVSLISGMIFTLAVGFAIDRFSEAGNVEGGFIFLACGILVASLFDLSCLLIMKSYKVEKSPTSSEPIISVVKKLLKNRAFLCLLAVGALFYAAQYMTNSFMGIYKISESDLGFSVGEAQLINIAGLLFRFAISKPLGKFSDKTSYCTGMLLGFSMLCVCFFLNIFTSPSARWMIFAYSLLYNGSLAAIHQNFMNITFDYVENDYFVQASSIKSALSGVCGFLSTLVGARILSTVQNNQNSLFGINIRGQQVLSAISFLIMLILLALVFFVLRKQKKLSDN